MIVSWIRADFAAEITSSSVASGRAYLEVKGENEEGEKKKKRER
jgi:hypothetical protein